MAGGGGGGHPAVTQAPSPLPPYTSAHLSCVAISISCIPTEGTGWDGNKAEEGYAPATRKAAWSYTRARKQAGLRLHLGLHTCLISAPSPGPCPHCPRENSSALAIWEVSQAGQTRGAGQGPSLGSRRSQFHIGTVPQLQEALGTQ